MKSWNRPRNFNKGFNHNYDLQKTLDRLTIPNFDGARGGSARIWVQKLDTYFQLNPMIEKDAIKLATLHLDEEAHEWWYHELVTLGHNTISSFVSSHRSSWSDMTRRTRRYTLESWLNSSKHVVLRRSSQIFRG